jgi:hypothetical protein
MKTTPNAPSPICSRSLYLPMVVPGRSVIGDERQKLVSGVRFALLDGG